MNWRVPINEILFGLKFTKELTDETVRWNADNALHYTVFDLGPEVYYQAIRDALSSGERLDELGQLPQFNEAQIADFLRAMAARLDEMRPWPEPTFRRIDDPDQWATFAQSKPIARLNGSIRQVTNELKKGFRPAGDAHPGLYILMLRLATGETVALQGRHGPGEKVTLFTEGDDDNADQTIEHFIAATGYPADKISRI